jgi:hypothetical protein
VLAEGRLRATWRLQSAGGRTTLSVSMVPGERRLDEADLGEQARAVSKVLAVEIASVEVTSPGR